MRIMYYCTGDGKHRSYEDYINFGFIAAGQQGTGKTKKLYSEELKLLKKGDYFFAFNKKKTEKKYGFIAFGQILEEAKRIDDFRLDKYPNKRLWEIEALKQKNIRENHDNAASEYCCKVKWLKIFNENETVRFTDSKYTSAFTGKTVSTFNTANQKYILNKLIEKFKISDEHNIPITNNEEKDMTEGYKNLLLNTHNIILHGAPGTGKTYLARKIAEALGCSENEIGFVQFHPSYDYTDFVEGLRPVKDNSSGQIGFERKDGVFKKFCERAELEDIRNYIDDAIKNKKEFYTKNYCDSKTEYENNYSFKIIEIKDRFLKIGAEGLNSKAQREKVFGENTFINVFQNEVNLLYLNKLFEEDISSQYDIKKRFVDIKEHSDIFYYSLYRALKESLNKRKFVFIIDEINRGDMSKIFGELFYAIDPDYRGKKGKISTQYQNLVSESNVFYDGFFIPENVYIIGTMNDIDRGVESMDFAFRRRFTFVEVKASDRIEMLDELDDEIREEARSRINALNNAIWNDEKKIGTDGLSSAYHIGGAYFLKLKELGGDFNLLWEYHLAPLLKEYLRGMENEDEKFDALKKAYDNPQVSSEEE